MVPDHPREWSSEPLAELADPNVPHSFIDGDWIESPYITDSGVRLIQTGNVGTGSFKDKSNRKFVSQDSFKELGCKYVMPGDLLFCRLADPIGRSCRAPTLDGPMLTSVDVTIMRPNPKRVVTDYLVQLSNSNRWLRRAAELAGGSTRSRISRSNLGKMTVPLPPLPEQRKIAEILGSVDEAIRATEAVIEQTRKVKEGLLQELLTKGIGHTKFKQTEIGEIPVGWEAKLVTEVCEEVFLGLTSKVDYVKVGGVPLIRGRDLQAGRVDFSRARCISERQHKELTKRRRARRGDVLVSKSGTLGSCAIVDVDTEFSIYESIIDLQPKSSILRSDYLYWLMQAESTQERILGHKVGSTVGHLNLLQFRRLRIPVPPLVEQGELASTMVALEHSVNRSIKSLMSLQKTKSGLLQDLLAGKVRVKV